MNFYLFHLFSTVGIAVATLNELPMTTPTEAHSIKNSATTTVAYAGQEKIVDVLDGVWRTEATEWLRGMDRGAAAGAFCALRTCLFMLLFMYGLTAMLLFYYARPNRHGGG